MSKKLEWSEAEIQYLKDNYENNTSESVRMELYKRNKNREWTISSVNLKANDLGLKKKTSKKANPNFSSGGEKS